jgi:ATP-dependent Clp protease ATP-binding subunit ClpB
VDDIIVFKPLDTEDLTTIVDLQLRRLERLLADRKLNLEVTDAAKALIAEEGYDPAYGARPLKRAIQKHIQNPLAIRVLEGDFHEGDTVLVDREPGSAKLVFRRAGEREGVGV